MADKDTGPEAGAKGVVEGVKGKVKEATGALTDNEDLRQEDARSRRRPTRSTTSCAQGS